MYLINYAKSNPDLAILAVNTFVKDANDPNLLIRALAVRTMAGTASTASRIPVRAIAALPQGRRSIRPQDSCSCVAKLFDISPSMVEDWAVEACRSSFATNPTVVANAVAALHEILRIRASPSSR